MILSASFGSYPRPSSLREYQIKTHGKQKKTNHVPTKQDREKLREAMRQVVEDQTGLDIITDGQLTWDDFLASVASNFDGIRMGGLIRFYDNNIYYRRPVIESEIVNNKPSVNENISMLKDLNPGNKIKAVIPGPYSLYDLSDDKFYNEPAEGIAAMSEALQEEIKAIDADYIQIDEPSFSYSYDENLADDIKEELNKIIKKTNAKTIVSTYFGKISSNKLLGIDADYLGIDCVSHKENYESLVRSGIKNIQLGLLDARNTKPEDPVDLKNKIDMIGSDDMLLSTNCGMEFLPREYAIRKTDLLSTIANEE
jgi:5-methyltetrahydropteroyltriglutamate--homocysteine methyltransferase